MNKTLSSRYGCVPKVASPIVAGAGLLFCLALATPIFMLAPWLRFWPRGELYIDLFVPLLMFCILLFSVFVFLAFSCFSFVAFCGCLDCFAFLLFVCLRFVLFFVFVFFLVFVVLGFASAEAVDGLGGQQRGAEDSIN